MPARRTAATPCAPPGGVGDRRATRVKVRRRAVTAAVGLAAYLAVFVTSPAWHIHAGGDRCCETATEAPAAAACGHSHAHAGHDRRPADVPTPPAPSGGDDCDLCDLLAQCPLPVTPPALADAGEPLPAVAAETYRNAEEAFLRTWSARGPPRA